MTITLTREEAQQVLDVLNDVRYRIEFGQMNLSDDTDAVIELLRTRLAQPEPEPVAWYWSRGVEFTIAFEEMDGHAPMYLHPPQREWQGLTDEEIDKALWENESNYLPDIIRIAEAKLKEKNC
jgi:hypothetical protein